MKSAPRAPIKRRRKDRNYSGELFHLLWAKESLAQIRETLAKTGAVQTRACAARLAKSLDGALRNARAHANG